MHLDEKLTLRIEQAISDKLFPGMGIVYGTLHERKEIYVGHQTYESTSPQVDTSTVYDVASITKTFTSAGILRLISEGKLRLCDSLGDLLDAPALQSVQLIHALSHTSGLKLSFGIYKDDPDKIRDQALITSPDGIPGTYYWYSTLNPYLLGLLIEKITGEKLDRALSQLIFDPLRMRNTEFNPARNSWDHIPPTEIDSWRNKTVKGEVHDEAAYALGGLTGFAGAFSTSSDLFEFCRMYMNKGSLYNTTIISWSLFDESVRVTFPDAPEAPNFNFRYGFCGLRVCPRDRVGTRASERTLEHSGFTGPEVIIDLDRNLATAFTSNSTYPHRPKSFEKHIALRAELFDMMCNEY